MSDRRALSLPPADKTLERFRGYGPAKSRLVRLQRACNELCKAERTLRDQLQVVREREKRESDEEEEESAVDVPELVLQTSSYIRPWEVAHEAKLRRRFQLMPRKVIIPPQLVMKTPRERPKTAPKAPPYPRFPPPMPWARNLREEKVEIGQAKLPFDHIKIRRMGSGMTELHEMEKEARRASKREEGGEEEQPPAARRRPPSAAPSFDDSTAFIPQTTHTPTNTTPLPAASASDRTTTPTPLPKRGGRESVLTDGGSSSEGLHTPFARSRPASASSAPPKAATRQRPMSASAGPRSHQRRPPPVPPLVWYPRRMTSTTPQARPKARSKSKPASPRPRTVSPLPSSRPMSSRAPPVSITLAQRAPVAVKGLTVLRERERARTARGRLEEASEIETETMAEPPSSLRFNALLEDLQSRPRLPLEYFDTQIEGGVSFATLDDVHTGELGETQLPLKLEARSPYHGTATVVLMPPTHPLTSAFIQYVMLQGEEGARWRDKYERQPRSVTRMELRLQRDDPQEFAAHVVAAASRREEAEQRLRRHLYITENQWTHVMPPYRLPLARLHNIAVLCGLSPSVIRSLVSSKLPPPSLCFDSAGFRPRKDAGGRFLSPERRRPSGPLFYERDGSCPEGMTPRDLAEKREKKAGEFTRMDVETVSVAEEGSALAEECAHLKMESYRWNLVDLLLQVEWYFAYSQLSFRLDQRWNEVLHRHRLRLLPPIPIAQPKRRPSLPDVRAFRHALPILSRRLVVAHAPLLAVTQQILTTFDDLGRDRSFAFIRLPTEAIGPAVSRPPSPPRQSIKDAQHGSVDTESIFSMPLSVSVFESAQVKHRVSVANRIEELWSKRVIEETMHIVAQAYPEDVDRWGKVSEVPTEVIACLQLGNKMGAAQFKRLLLLSFADFADRLKWHSWDEDLQQEQISEETALCEEISPMALITLHRKRASSLFLVSLATDTVTVDAFGEVIEQASIPKITFQPPSSAATSVMCQSETHSHSSAAIEADKQSVAVTARSEDDDSRGGRDEERLVMRPTEKEVVEALTHTIFQHCLDVVNELRSLTQSILRYVTDLPEDCQHFPSSDLYDSELQAILKGVKSMLEHGLMPVRALRNNYCRFSSLLIGTSEAFASQLLLDIRRMEALETLYEDALESYLDDSNFILSNPSMYSRTNPELLSSILEQKLGLPLSQDYTAHVKRQFSIRRDTTQTAMDTTSEEAEAIRMLEAERRPHTEKKVRELFHEVIEKYISRWYRETHDIPLIHETREQEPESTTEPPEEPAPDDQPPAEDEHARRGVGFQEVEIHEYAVDEQEEGSEVSGESEEEEEESSGDEEAKLLEQEALEQQEKAWLDALKQEVSLRVKIIPVHTRQEGYDAIKLPKFIRVDETKLTQRIYLSNEEIGTLMAEYDSLVEQKDAIIGCSASTVHLSLFAVNCQNARLRLIAHADERLRSLSSFIVEEFSSLSDYVLDRFDALSLMLEDDVTSIETLARQYEKVRELYETGGEGLFLDTLVQHARTIYDFFETRMIKVDMSVHIKHVMLKGSPNKLRMLAQRKQVDLISRRQLFTYQLEYDHTSLNRAIAASLDAIRELKSVGPSGTKPLDADTVDKTLDGVNRVKDDLDKCQDMYETFVTRQLALGVPQTKSPLEMETAWKTLQPYLDFWTSAQQAYSAETLWCHGPLTSLTLEECQDTLASWRTITERCLKMAFTSAPIPSRAARNTLDKLKELEAFLPLIACLRFKGFLARHWSVLSRLVKEELNPDHLTLAQMLVYRFHVPPRVVFLQRLTERSAKELWAEKCLMQIEQHAAAGKVEISMCAIVSAADGLADERLTSRSVSRGPSRSVTETDMELEGGEESGLLPTVLLLTNGVSLLGKYNHLIGVCEGLRQSGHAHFFADRLAYVVHRLEISTDFLRMWVQAMPLYLQYLLAIGPDGMSTETIQQLRDAQTSLVGRLLGRTVIDRFRKVDGLFRQAMSQVNPSPFKHPAIENWTVNARVALQEINSIRTILLDRLESQRRDHPRLLLPSDEALHTLFTSFSACQWPVFFRVIACCFPGIRGVKLEEDSDDDSSMDETRLSVTQIFTTCSDTLFLTRKITLPASPFLSVTPKPASVTDMMGKIDDSIKQNLKTAVVTCLTKLMELQERIKERAGDVAAAMQRSALLKAICSHPWQVILIAVMAHWTGEVERALVVSGLTTDIKTRETLMEKEGLSVVQSHMSSVLQELIHQLRSLRWPSKPKTAKRTRRPTIRKSIMYKTPQAKAVTDTVGRSRSIVTTQAPPQEGAQAAAEVHVAAPLTRGQELLCRKMEHMIGLFTGLKDTTSELLPLAETGGLGAFEWLSCFRVYCLDERAEENVPDRLPPSTAGLLQPQADRKPKPKAKPKAALGILEAPSSPSQGKHVSTGPPDDDSSSHDTEEAQQQQDHHQKPAPVSVRALSRLTSRCFTRAMSRSWDMQEAAEEASEAEREEDTLLEAIVVAVYPTKMLYGFELLPEACDFIPSTSHTAPHRAFFYSIHSRHLPHFMSEGDCQALKEISQLIGRLLLSVPSLAPAADFCRLLSAAVQMGGMFVLQDSHLLQPATCTAVTQALDAVRVASIREEREVDIPFVTGESRVPLNPWTIVACTSVSSARRDVPTTLSEAFRNVTTVSPAPYAVLELMMSQKGFTPTACQRFPSDVIAFFETFDDRGLYFREGQLRQQAARIVIDQAARDKQMMYLNSTPAVVSESVEYLREMDALRAALMFVTNATMENKADEVKAYLDGVLAQTTDVTVGILEKKRALHASLPAEIETPPATAVDPEPVSLVSAKMQALADILPDVISSLGLVVSPVLVQRCLSLAEWTETKAGVIIVGSSSVGKSTVMTVLAMAINRLHQLFLESVMYAAEGVLRKKAMRPARQSVLSIAPTPPHEDTQEADKSPHVSPAAVRTGGVSLWRSFPNLYTHKELSGDERTLVTLTEAGSGAGSLRARTHAAAPSILPSILNQIRFITSYLQATSHRDFVAGKIVTHYQTADKTKPPMPQPTGLHEGLKQVIADYLELVEPLVHNFRSYDQWQDDLLSIECPPVPQRAPERQHTGGEGDRAARMITRSGTSMMSALQRREAAQASEAKRRFRQQFIAMTPFAERIASARLQHQCWLSLDGALPSCDAPEASHYSRLLDRIQSQLDEPSEDTDKHKTDRQHRRQSTSAWDGGGRMGRRASQFCAQASMLAKGPSRMETGQSLKASSIGGGQGISDGILPSADEMIKLSSDGSVNARGDWIKKVRLLFETTDLANASPALPSFVFRPLVLHFTSTILQPCIRLIDHILTKQDPPLMRILGKGFHTWAGGAQGVSIISNLYSSAIAGLSTQWLATLARVEELSVSLPATEGAASSEEAEKEQRLRVKARIRRELETVRHTIEKQLLFAASQAIFSVIRPERSVHREETVLRYATPSPAASSVELADETAEVLAEGPTEGEGEVDTEQDKGQATEKTQEEVQDVREMDETEEQEVHGHGEENEHKEAEDGERQPSEGPEEPELPSPSSLQPMEITGPPFSTARAIDSYMRLLVWMAKEAPQQAFTKNMAMSAGLPYTQVLSSAQPKTNWDHFWEIIEEIDSTKLNGSIHVEAETAKTEKTDSLTVDAFRSVFLPPLSTKIENPPMESEGGRYTFVWEYHVRDKAADSHDDTQTISASQWRPWDGHDSEYADLAFTNRLLLSTPSIIRVHILLQLCLPCLNRHPALIIGPAFSGKSTLLRHLAYDWQHGGRHTARGIIPPLMDPSEARKSGDPAIVGSVCMPKSHPAVIPTLVSDKRPLSAARMERQIESHLTLKSEDISAKEVWSPPLKQTLAVMIDDLSIDQPGSESSEWIRQFVETSGYMSRRPSVWESTASFMTDLPPREEGSTSSSSSGSGNGCRDTAGMEPSLCEIFASAYKKVDGVRFVAAMSAGGSAVHHRLLSKGVMLQLHEPPLTIGDISHVYSSLVRSAAHLSNSNWGHAMLQLIHSLVRASFNAIIPASTRIASVTVHWLAYSYHTIRSLLGRRISVAEDVDSDVQETLTVPLLAHCLENCLGRLADELLGINMKEKVLEMLTAEEEHDLGEVRRLKHEVCRYLRMEEGDKVIGLPSLQALGDSCLVPSIVPASGPQGIVKQLQTVCRGQPRARDTATAATSEDNVDLAYRGSRASPFAQTFVQHSLPALQQLLTSLPSPGGTIVLAGPAASGKETLLHMTCSALNLKVLSFPALIGGVFAAGDEIRDRTDGTTPSKEEQIAQYARDRYEVTSRPDVLAENREEMARRQWTLMQDKLLTTAVNIGLKRIKSRLQQLSHLPDTVITTFKRRYTSTESDAPAAILLDSLSLVWHADLPLEAERGNDSAQICRGLVLALRAEEVALPFLRERLTQLLDGGSWGSLLDDNPSFGENLNGLLYAIGDCLDETYLLVRRALEQGAVEHQKSLERRKQDGEKEKKRRRGREAEVQAAKDAEEAAFWRAVEPLLSEPSDFKPSQWLSKATLMSLLMHHFFLPTVTIAVITATAKQDRDPRVTDILLQEGKQPQVKPRSEPLRQLMESNSLCDPSRSQVIYFNPLPLPACIDIASRHLTHLKKAQANDTAITTVYEWTIQRSQTQMAFSFQPTEAVSLITKALGRLFAEFKSFQVTEEAFKACAASMWDDLRRKSSEEDQAGTPRLTPLAELRGLVSSNDWNPLCIASGPSQARYGPFTMPDPFLRLEDLQRVQAYCASPTRLIDIVEMACDILSLSVNHNTRTCERLSRVKELIEASEGKSDRLQEYVNIVTPRLKSISAYIEDHTEQMEAAKKINDRLKQKLSTGIYLEEQTKRMQMETLTSECDLLSRRLSAASSAADRIVAERLATGKELDALSAIKKPKNETKKIVQTTCVALGLKLRRPAPAVAAAVDATEGEEEPKTNEAEFEGDPQDFWNLFLSRAFMQTPAGARGAARKLTTFNKEEMTEGQLIALKRCLDECPKELATGVAFKWISAAATPAVTALYVWCKAIVDAAEIAVELQKKRRELAATEVAHSELAEVTQESREDARQSNETLADLQRKLFDATAERESLTQSLADVNERGGRLDRALSMLQTEKDRWLSLLTHSLDQRRFLLSDALLMSCNMHLLGAFPYPLRLLILNRWREALTAMGIPTQASDLVTSLPPAPLPTKSLYRFWTALDGLLPDEDSFDSALRIHWSAVPPSMEETGRRRWLPPLIYDPFNMAMKFLLRCHMRGVAEGGIGRVKTPQAKSAVLKEDVSRPLVVSLGTPGLRSSSLLKAIDYCLKTGTPLVIEFSTTPSMPADELQEAERLITLLLKRATHLITEDEGRQMLRQLEEWLDPEGIDADRIKKEGILSYNHWAAHRDRSWATDGMQTILLQNDLTPVHPDFRLYLLYGESERRHVIDRWSPYGTMVDFSGGRNAVVKCVWEALMLEEKKEFLEEKIKAVAEGARSHHQLHYAKEQLLDYLVRTYESNQFHEQLLKGGVLDEASDEGNGQATRRTAGFQVGLDVLEGLTQLKNEHDEIHASLRRSDELETMIINDSLETFLPLIETGVHTIMCYLSCSHTRPTSMDACQRLVHLALAADEDTRAHGGGPQGKKPDTQHKRKGQENRNGRRTSAETAKSSTEPFRSRLFRLLAMRHPPQFYDDFAMCLAFGFPWTSNIPSAAENATLLRFSHDMSRYDMFKDVSLVEHLLSPRPDVLTREERHKLELDPMYRLKMRQAQGDHRITADDIHKAGIVANTGEAPDIHEDALAVVNFGELSHNWMVFRILSDLEDMVPSLRLLREKDEESPRASSPSRRRRVTDGDAPTMHSWPHRFRHLPRLWRQWAERMLLILEDNTTQQLPDLPAPLPTADCSTHMLLLAIVGCALRPADRQRILRALVGFALKGRSWRHRWTDGGQNDLGSFLDQPEGSSHDFLSFISRSIESHLSPTSLLPFSPIIIHGPPQAIPTLDMPCLRLSLQQGIAGMGKAGDVGEALKQGTLVVVHDAHLACDADVRQDGLEVTAHRSSKRACNKHADIPITLIELVEQLVRERLRSDPPSHMPVDAFWPIEICRGEGPIAPQLGNKAKVCLVVASPLQIERVLAPSIVRQSLYCRVSEAADAASILSSAVRSTAAIYPSASAYEHVGANPPPPPVAESNGASSDWPREVVSGVLALSQRVVFLLMWLFTLLSMHTQRRSQISISFAQLTSAIVNVEAFFAQLLSYIEEHDFTALMKALPLPLAGGRLKKHQSVEVFSRRLWLLVKTTLQSCGWLDAVDTSLVSHWLGVAVDLFRREMVRAVEGASLLPVNSDEPLYVRKPSMQPEPPKDAPARQSPLMERRRYTQAKGTSSTQVGVADPERPTGPSYLSELLLPPPLPPLRVFTQRANGNGTGREAGHIDEGTGAVEACMRWILSSAFSSLRTPAAPEAPMSLSFPSADPSSLLDFTRRLTDALSVLLLAPPAPSSRPKFTLGQPPPSMFSPAPASSGIVSPRVWRAVIRRVLERLVYVIKRAVRPVKGERREEGLRVMRWVPLIEIFEKEMERIVDYLKALRDRLAEAYHMHPAFTQLLLSTTQQTADDHADAPLWLALSSPIAPTLHPSIAADDTSRDRIEGTVAALLAGKLSPWKLIARIQGDIGYHRHWLKCLKRLPVDISQDMLPALHLGKHTMATEVLSAVSVIMHKATHDKSSALEWRILRKGQEHSTKGAFCVADMVIAGLPSSSVGVRWDDELECLVGERLVCRTTTADDHQHDKQQRFSSLLPPFQLCIAPSSQRENTEEGDTRLSVSLALHGTASFPPLAPLATIRLPVDAAGLRREAGPGDRAAERRFIPQPLNYWTLLKAREEVWLAPYLP
ncbi:unnamed protein product [Vitrella brassicaformis CCMP3155]|uniref:Dynein heavy chain linker domain-containing protein n=6 Tax=Vitrella brassicaformis TaxID=1169539 RepID=A0A0G4ECI3_VITBC|nr:unnamed protein product [Vitrella brassicaformis CCMP3155]|eukprot:CEL93447.1 unnamed protein product [Vitrella brassicaformis CCMP3155]